MPRAPIAQLVELRTFNPQVVGSSPTGGTSSGRAPAGAVRGGRLTEARIPRPAAAVVIPAATSPSAAPTSPTLAETVAARHQAATPSPPRARVMTKTDDARHQPPDQRVRSGHRADG